MISAVRILGALQYLGYSKLLRLSSPSDSALGQFITFVSADHERIQDAIVTGTSIMIAPISFILSFAYAVYLIGPSAIVGCLIIVLYLPISVSFQSR